MDIEKEREAFEAAYARAFPIAASRPGKFDREDWGDYVDASVGIGWRMWQAGRAALQSQNLTVDDLAQEIRRVDGNHSLGAGALAEALMPFIQSALQSQDREDAIEEGFRWRSINPPYKIWNYVWDRAPDSWELREAEIQNVVVYARRIEGEGE